MTAMTETRLKRVGLVFSGGPAPAANAVIAAAASAFRRAGTEVIAILQGYSRLVDYRDGDELAPGIHYRMIEDRELRGLRNSRGVVLGTARANPGSSIRSHAQLDDPQLNGGLRAVYGALCELELDGLISIGGDGTLRTANLLHAYQERLPASAPRVRIVHVPKTVDNDYAGIDFTFGFFTAVDVMAKELLNLRADAIATQSYYLVATMGRRAGWLAYGVAVAGEAHQVIGVEDVHGPLCRADGKLDLNALVDHIVDLIETRRRRGKPYGVVVLAEGLTELLPDSDLGDAPRDAYGHISFATFDLSRVLAARVAERCKERSGHPTKVTGLQLGYESRCAAPHAFDVLLGSQLGLGAYRALAELGLAGHMISISGQLDLRYVPFKELVREDLGVDMRLIERGSDFHRLAQELGTRIDTDVDVREREG
jgi:ATP-dependent phosphofructokinase / diphosphate-dependent phosphofructokinase